MWEHPQKVTNRQDFLKERRNVEVSGFLNGTDDVASLEDLRLLLQKERVVFSITSMSLHVIFATIFTPCVVIQKAVNTRLVKGWSKVSQPMTANVVLLFMKSTICIYIYAYNVHVCMYICTGCFGVDHSLEQH